MKRTLRTIALGTGSGTIVLVVWGMIFWAWLADPVGVFHTLPNAETVTQLLEANDTVTGTYFMPWPRDSSAAFAAFVDQHKRGPFFMLSFVREGVDPQSPGKLVLGTLHYASVSLLAVLLLLVTRARHYATRAAIVVLAGLLGTNFITLASPVWFHLPWDYTLGNILYEFVAWVFLAAVTAGVVRPAHNLD